LEDDATLRKRSRRRRRRRDDTDNDGGPGLQKKALTETRTEEETWA
jgi:hypothetical protein